ncbi:hypothetical protein CAAN1_24S01222 [[Candida] anglica]|uniref:Mitochondrial group I intron splicing factor CCM1 n=1 Tax=[Candida] anglica TaxID=148631 RepID=A0ABP0EDN9_9ASCO
MSLHKSLERLSTRLRNGKSLLFDKTSHLIQSNRSLLNKKFKFDGNIDGIWDHLGRVSHKDNHITSESVPECKEPPIQDYLRFLKYLYPQDPWNGIQPVSKTSKLSFNDQIRKYSKINHQALYTAYQALPHPPPMYIKPKDLVALLDVFLDRRDFINANPLLNAHSKAPLNAVYDAYKMALGKRKHHLGQCNRIMSDMRQCGMPISSRQRSKLIKMTFFKDKPSILAQIEAYVQTLPFNQQERARDSVGNSPGGYHTTRLGNTFNWEVYRQILSSGSDNVETRTYNSLLFAAIRHDSERVIQDIYTSGFSQETFYKPNRKTVGLFLGYFAQTHSLVQFKKLLDYMVDRKDLVPDTHTIDAVMSGLLNLGLEQEAEQLFHSCYLEGDSGNVYLDAKYSDLKQLSSEDCFVYRDKLKRFDSLIRILEESRQADEHDTDGVKANILSIIQRRETKKELETYQFKLLPTETTFHLFIEYYSKKGEINKCLNLIELMESKFGLPVTTRIYKHLFANDSNTLDDLVQLTMRFLQSYDTANSSYGDATHEKLNQLEVPAKLRDFLNVSLVYTPDPYYIPKSRGSYVKISKDFLFVVQNAFRNQFLGPGPGDEAIVQNMESRLSTLWQSERQRIERDNYTKRQDINNEIKYLRKAYLVELLDEMMSLQQEREEATNKK